MTYGTTAYIGKPSCFHFLIHLFLFFAISRPEDVPAPFEAQPAPSAAIPAPSEALPAPFVACLALSEAFPGPLGGPSASFESKALPVSSEDLYAAYIHRLDTQHNQSFL